MNNKLTVFIACYSKTDKEILQQTVDSIKEQGIEPICDFDEGLTADRWTAEIERCDTEFLHFAHHDDMYLPGFYEKTIAWLEAHPDAAAVFTSDYTINREGHRVAGSNDYAVNEDGHRIAGSKLPFEEQDSYGFEFILNNMIRHGNFLRCPSVVFRVEKVKGLAYPTTCGSASDTSMWFNVLDRGRIGIIDEPLYIYRLGGDTHSTTSSDHVLAIEYAMNLSTTKYLRPYILDWDTQISFGRMVRHKEEQDEKRRIEAKVKEAKECTFHVCHEPPDNAGTGILLAERVRNCNRGDAGVVAWYVCPSPEGNQKSGEVYRGVPVLTCYPSAFHELVDEHKPTLIEYHHLLRWDLDILDVKTSARKEFWIHDSHTFCERWHLFNGKEACDGPTPEKCASTCGVSADEVQEKSAYLQPALGKMDQVIANSEYSKTVFEKYMGVDAIVVEPIPAPLPLYPKRKVFGYFGSWYPVKGFQILLKAMQKVKWGQLIMFTDAPTYALDGGRKLFGYDNVLVFGRYNRESLPYLLNLCSFVVVPSINESFGLVKRECEALGIPVIATDAGGMDGSVPPGYSNALAKAIQEAIDA